MNKNDHKECDHSLKKLFDRLKLIQLKSLIYNIEWISILKCFQIIVKKNLILNNIIIWTYTIHLWDHLRFKKYIYIYIYYKYEDEYIRSKRNTQILSA